VFERVVNFESAGQPSSFFGLKRFVEGSGAVGVEIVHDQADFCGARIAFVEHAFDEGRPIFAGSVFCDVNVTASGQRFDFQKYFRDPVANILVVDDLTPPRRWSQGLVDFANQLLVGFVHADDRKKRVVGRVVNIQNILHAHDKSGAAIGGNLPVFAQVRLKFIFFKAR
jgi:hypothetical protein